MSGRRVSASPQRSTPKAEETRRRILSAALDLFQERGFAETTMRDIAKRAEVATGAAYYYFPSKESIVLAFYWETHTAFDSAYKKPLARTADLATRIRILIELKLEQFQPYREFLGALFRSAGDPASPLSPFSEETWEIREQSIDHFRTALEGSRVKTPADLARHLPYLLWLYQMGILLFWIYDRSPRQTKTEFLLAKSSSLVAAAIKLSRFPLLKPFRESALAVLNHLMDDDRNPKEARAK
jgi:AcrR family transcriptional regulator